MSLNPKLVLSSSPSLLLSSEVATSAALAPPLLGHHSLATMQTDSFLFPPSLPSSLPHFFSPYFLKDRDLAVLPGRPPVCIAGIKQTLETCVGNLKFKGSFQTGVQNISVLMTFVLMTSVLMTSVLMTSVLMTSAHRPGSSYIQAPLPLCAHSASLLPVPLTGDS